MPLQRYEVAVLRPGLQLLVLAATTLAGVVACTSPRGPAPVERERENVASVPATPAAPGVTALPAPGPQARNAWVLLSGGGTPLTNNYSQFLQARAMAGFFARECPADATWIFFGVGNRDGAPPVLADVRREMKRDGRVVQSWLPGILPRNRPATRDSFLRALREEILPTVHDGGTLYLFVGDHGEITGSDDHEESAITMWQLKPGRRRNRAWYTDEKEILGVAELREVLTQGIGRGRVVFCMTQCHSGGFHDLGLAREMSPPREWFTNPPAWSALGGGNLRLPIAGFTATDQDSIAAGCDADPDPERWAGYERFMPEGLLGVNLMTGQAKSAGARSFAEAHVAAVLTDETIDKPRATSDYYLRAWAELIETKLSTTLAVTARTREAVEAYRRAVDRGIGAVTDPALRERQALLEQFTRRLTEQSPTTRELLLAGTRAQLQSAIDARERGGGAVFRGNRRGQMVELRKLWAETLRPAWKAAVVAGRVEGLSGVALEFEKELIRIEEGGRDLLLSRGGDNTALQNEIFWASGYAEPATLDRAKAEAVAKWGAMRRGRIIEWGKRSSDATVRAAAEKIGPGPVYEDEPPEPLSRKTAAARALYYRRVLAAWQFLLTMEAKAALAELQVLIELENSPLRPVAER